MVKSKYEFTNRVTNGCVCRDCGGVLYAKNYPEDRNYDQICCVNCGDDFSGWISKKKLEHIENKQVLIRNTVLTQYPEWRGNKMTRIKTLRGRKLPFPEIGKIRKGTKEINDQGKVQLIDLDHFRVVFNEGEEAAAEVFRSHYGDMPREINIRFPTNDINFILSHSLAAFTAGGMYAESDGEIYTYLADGKTGEVLVKDGLDVKTGNPRPYIEGEPATHYIDSKGKEAPLYCEASGQLRVMVPELRRAAYLTVTTNAWNDIETLDAQLFGLSDLSGGKLQGLPVILKRRPEMISTPGKDGKRIRRKKWMLQLEVDPAYAAARFDEFERLIYSNTVTAPALTEGDDYEAEEEDVEALEAEYTEGTPEPEGVPELDPEEAPASGDDLWNKVKGIVLPLDNPRAVAMGFVDLLKITNQERLNMLCNRIGLDPDKERDLIGSILQATKDRESKRFDYVTAIEKLLQHVGWEQLRSSWRG